MRKEILATIMDYVCLRRLTNTMVSLASPPTLKEIVIKINEQLDAASAKYQDNIDYPPMRVLREKLDESDEKFEGYCNLLRSFSIASIQGSKELLVKEMIRWYDHAVKYVEPTHGPVLRENFTKFGSLDTEQIKQFVMPPDAHVFEQKYAALETGQRRKTPSAMLRQRELWSNQDGLLDVAAMLKGFAAASDTAKESYWKEIRSSTARNPAYWAEGLSRLQELSPLLNTEGEKIITQLESTIGQVTMNAVNSSRLSPNRS